STCCHPIMISLFWLRQRPHRQLHSFPTRRSSDLVQAAPAVVMPGVELLSCWCLRTAPGARPTVSASLSCEDADARPVGARHAGGSMSITLDRNRIAELTAREAKRLD